jgi:hypothetical protein
MFEVDQVSARLTSVNPRAEIHGDDTVPAADLGLTFDAPNSILAHFGPQLLGSLYSKAVAKDAPPAAAQGELDTVPQVSNQPHLRNPSIDGALKIRFEGIGYKVRFDHGLGGDSDIAFEGVKVNGIRLTPKEGGTVSVALRVQITDPEPGDLGHLCQRIGNDVRVSLEAPSSDQQPLAA